MTPSLLRSLRLARGLTQRELGLRLYPEHPAGKQSIDKMPQAAVSRLETGRVPITTAMAERLRAILGE